MLRSGSRVRLTGWACQECGHFNAEDDFNCDGDECTRARRAEEEREEREDRRRVQIERRRLKKNNQRLRDALVEHDVAMFAITGNIRAFDLNPQCDALRRWRGN